MLASEGSLEMNEVEKLFAKDPLREGILCSSGTYFRKQCGLAGGPPSLPVGVVIL